MHCLTVLSTRLQLGTECTECWHPCHHQPDQPRTRRMWLCRRLCGCLHRIRRSQSCCRCLGQHVLQDSQCTCLCCPQYALPSTDRQHKLCMVWRCSCHCPPDRPRTRCTATRCIQNTCQEHKVCTLLMGHYPHQQSRWSRMSTPTTQHSRTSRPSKLRTHLSSLHQTTD